MEQVKFTAKLSGLLGISILAGFILLVIAYLIPVEPMQPNAKKSGFLLGIEGSYPVIYENMEVSKVDNWVNALMINTAAFDGNEPLIDKAINAYSVRYADENLIFALPHYHSENSGGESHVAYTRYWHGYLIFLKPLLLLFDVNELQLLNLLFMSTLILLTAYHLHKRQLGRYIVPYIATILFLFPILFYKVLLYYGVFYLIHVAILVMLSRHEYLTMKDRYRYFFFIVGIIACYVDILSFPLLSLGMPLTIYFILTKPDTIRAVITKFFSYSVLWTLGFSLMWSGKWITASIISGSMKPVREALFSLTERSSTINYMTGAQFTRIDAVLENIRMVIEPYFFVVFLISIGTILLYYLKKKHDALTFHQKSVYIGFLLIAAAPFAWYFLTANHSYLHAYFTYKVMAMSIFSILSAVVYFLESQNGFIHKANRQNSKARKVEKSN